MQTKLIAIRKFNNVTQKEMAAELGVDLRTYINKEQGESQFKINEMFAIAQKFETQIGEIFLPPNFIKHEVSEGKEDDCSCSNSQ